MWIFRVAEKENVPGIESVKLLHVAPPVSCFWRRCGNFQIRNYLVYKIFDV